jgi:hypothetical protein
MVDPDYAGAIRNGINENLNGVRTSSSNFSVPSIYNGTDKSTSRIKRKEMSRTSGVMGHKDIYSNTLFDVQTVNNGERYRSPNDKEMFGPIDTRPGWMQTSDAQRKNYDRFGTTNPSFGQITADTVGIGTNRSGNFQFDPGLAALSFAPVGRILGPLGKIFGAGRKLIPAAVRFDTAAANLVGRAARNAKRARLAVEDAAWLEEQGINTANAGRKAASTPLRTETNVYRDLGHDAFDRHLGSELTHTNVGGSMTLRDAENLVRLGEATVEYTSQGTKVYRNLRGQRMLEEGTALANSAARTGRQAAEAARRAENISEYLGNRGVKEVLKKRVKNLQEVRARLQRNPGAGGGSTPPSTAW